MEDMASYLESGGGNVAILDATNTTRKRRATVVDFCEKKGFVESNYDEL